MTAQLAEVGETIAPRKRSKVGAVDFGLCL
jgi:hypothetical protein